MVPRHLLQLAVMMALVVLVPCVSYAATPVEVTASSSVSTYRTYTMISDFMSLNAQNVVDSFEFQSSSSADYITSRLNVSYPAAVSVKTGTKVVVSQLASFGSSSIYNLMSAVSASSVLNVNLMFAVWAEAANMTAEVNAGNIDGFGSATQKDDVATATPSGVAVVLQTNSTLTASRAKSVLNSFLGDNANNRVSSLDTMFYYVSSADTTVASLKKTYPAAVAVRSGHVVPVSGLSGFNVDSIARIVDAVYNVNGAITSFTVLFGDESSANDMIVMVNAGNVSGFASASKPATAEDDGAPVGAIVGGIFGAIAGVLLIAAIAALIYWKCFMTKGGDTKAVDEEVNTTNNSPNEITTAEA